MSSTLKLAIFATGLSAGLAGYCAYRHFSDKAATKAPQVAAPAPTPAVVEPVVDAPKKTSKKATAVRKRVERPECHIVEVAARVGDETSNTLHLPAKPAEPAVVSAPAAEDDSVAVTLPMILGKQIVIQGLEIKKTADRFLFTDGHQQVIEPTMSADEAKQVNRLHAQMARRITDVLHHRGTEAILSRKARVGRLAIKTFTEANTNLGGSLLMQIVGNKAPVFSNLRAVYLYVQRDDLIIPTVECMIGSAEWTQQTEALFTHLRYALEGQGDLSSTEWDEILVTMRAHFRTLYAQLARIHLKVPA